MDVLAGRGAAEEVLACMTGRLDRRAIDGGDGAKRMSASKRMEEAKMAMPAWLRCIDGAPLTRLRQL